MIRIIFSHIPGRDQSYFQPAGFNILLYGLILIDRIHRNTYFRYRVVPDRADIAVLAMIRFVFFFTSIKNAQKFHTAALQLIGN